MNSLVHYAEQAYRSGCRKTKSLTVFVMIVAQLFVRGKVGIARLRKLVREGILISSKGESAGHATTLLNRLEQLEIQKRQLTLKSALSFFTDPDLENAIEIVDAEIKTVQGELANIASSKRKESEK